MIGRTGDGFATSAAAEWPSLLCEWTAKTIIAAYLQYSEQGGSNDCGKRKSGVAPEAEDVDPSTIGKKRRLEMDELEKDQSDPMNPPISGGTGPPRHCEWKGMKTPFHDGAVAFTRTMEEEG